MVGLHSRRTHRRSDRSRHSRHRGVSRPFGIFRRRQGCGVEVQRPVGTVGHPFRIGAYGQFAKKVHRSRRVPVLSRPIVSFRRVFERADLSYGRKLERSRYELFRRQSGLGGTQTRRFEIQDRRRTAISVRRRRPGGLRLQERTALSRRLP